MEMALYLDDGLFVVMAYYAAAALALALAIHHRFFAFEKPFGARCHARRNAATARSNVTT